MHMFNLVLIMTYTTWSWGYTCMRAQGQGVCQCGPQKDTIRKSGDYCFIKFHAVLMLLSKSWITKLCEFQRVVVQSQPCVFKHAGEDAVTELWSLQLLWSLRWRLSREDSSKGANTEYGVVVKEGLLFEERQQRLATNVWHILRARLSWMCRAVGWGGRESKLPAKGGTSKAKLGVPFHCHGFVTNWGLGMVVGVGVIYYFS